MNMKNMNPHNKAAPCPCITLISEVVVQTTNMLLLTWGNLSCRITNDLAIQHRIKLHLESLKIWCAHALLQILAASHP